MNREILVDNHERKSLSVLDEHFTVNMCALPIGDIAYEEYLIELKIGTDVHDYARMKDEFTRMSQTDKKLHAVYVGNDMKEYKIFVSQCQEYAIYAHCIYTLKQLPALLKKIFRGHYDISRAYFKKPASNLTYFQRSLAVLPGISEEIAAKCVWDSYNAMSAAFDASESIALKTLARWFGTKKDGTIKQLGIDFFLYYKTGVWRGQQ